MKLFYQRGYDKPEEITLLSIKVHSYQGYPAEIHLRTKEIASVTAAGIEVRDIGLVFTSTEN